VVGEGLVVSHHVEEVIGKFPWMENIDGDSYRLHAGTPTVAA
jgi:hypothetical protein